MSKPKKKPSGATLARPFETNYTGLWNGYCTTPENAIAAALNRVLAGAGKCTITNLATGETVARLRRREGTHAGVEVLTPDAILAQMAVRMRKRAEAMKRKLAEKRAAEKAAKEKS